MGIFSSEGAPKAVRIMSVFDARDEALREAIIRMGCDVHGEQGCTAVTMPKGNDLMALRRKLGDEDGGFDRLGSAVGKEGFL